MKKSLRKMKRSWETYWKDDQQDMTKTHLSQSDRRFLLCGAYLIALSVLLLVVIVMGISSRRSVREMRIVLNTITAYMATATEDEYEKTAEAIRHDLVFRDYGEEIEALLQYIPNTAPGCCLEQAGDSAGIKLVFLNTGVAYNLSGDQKSGAGGHAEPGRDQLSFGYDEISGASLSIIRHPEEGAYTATICQDRKIVSVQRMKSVFCDACIGEILKAAEGGAVSEAVLYDAAEQVFYPVKEGDLQIGDWAVCMRGTDTGYQIEAARREP